MAITPIHLPSTRSFFYILVIAAVVLIAFEFTFLYMPPKLDGSFPGAVNQTANEEIHEGNSSYYNSADIFEMNYAEMEREFKIFVYPDGDENTYFHTPRTVSGKYASEGFFFKNIRESNFITDDPRKAHLFFIPISCHKMREKVSSFEEMATIVEKYVELLIQKYPYWNRTLGADHFFVTCHEIDVAATEQMPFLAKNSIRVVCSSNLNSGFVPHKDVSLPLVMQPFSKPAGQDYRNRSILGYWAGNCNTDVRKALVNLWLNDDKLHIYNSTVHKAIKVEKFYRTKFCICPRAPRVTSSRITMAIHYGCVPVILSNNFDLPFNDVLDWRKFSVIVKERDVYKLKDILKAKSGVEFRRLHRNLLGVQRSFQWNSPPQKYDAFHMILYELWLRRHTVRY